jgi:DNA-binding transcriptional MerR regulator
MRPERDIIEQARAIGYLQGKAGLSLRGIARLLDLPAETVLCYAVGKRAAPEAVLAEIKRHSMSPKKAD